MTEAGPRAAFLANVRRAVSGAPKHHTRPTVTLPPTGPSRVAYAQGVGDDLDAQAEQFLTSLQVLGGTAERLQSAAAVADFVDRAIDSVRVGHEPVRVMLSQDPECDAVHAWLAERDDVVRVDHTDAAAAATVDIGFTGARAAVALTGSVVVDAGRAGGRTVSLLPPVHVVLVPTAALVSTPNDMWRTLTDPMPSNLVQITGPSRSADIELIITLGVHGPKALWAGLLG